MSKKLLIVESPAKAKTINKYLGEEFVVKSSYGHIRDLDKGKKGIEIENDFKPNYVVSDEKKRVVKELKDTLKKVSEVWLATDEDREGEAISWHLCEVLGLDENTTKRIVFREITKSAIQAAIKTPRIVDKNVVEAQQARRILDRLVGFELSEILWRKIKGKLSAGRVQSVAVKLIVDREREIMAHDAIPYYKVVGLFKVKNAQGKWVELKSELNKRLNSKEEAESLLNKLVGSDFTIDDIKVKPTKRKPAAPFTTSTLQQEASRKIYFSVNRTMSTAQRLYEAGHISYMRTDSISLSETALSAIESEIKSNYGDNYSQLRRYKSKNENAQEAHEAIRPTNFQNETIAGDSDMQRLYELIWKRTVASQMADAQLEKTTVNILSKNNDVFQAQGEVLKFDGFLKLYMEAKDEDEEDEDAKGILPPLSLGQKLDLDNVQAIERFTRPPSRYTEASLVKKLEELGIGRPSTYAPTITKITEKNRGYVNKESRDGVERKYNVLTLKEDVVSNEVKSEMTGSTSNRLYPTDMGLLVVDFLTEHFKNIMTYSFTAEIEGRLDEIAQGNEDWKKMLGEFYTPFHKTVEKTIEEAQRVKGRRDLGVDPVSGHTVLTQMTRFGPVVQIGTREEVGEDSKPRFASLKVGQSLETITYEEAMELFKLPIDIGEYLGETVTINSGRYGPYVKFKDKFISLAKGEDPMTVSMERAQELIDAKLKADAPVATYKGMDVVKGKGRFGPFLKWNDFFINIPRRYDSENLSIDEINELIEAKIEKEANRYIVRWEKEKIDLENGRWGPFIRYKKKSYKIGKKENGERYTPEEAKEKFTLEECKKILKEEGAKGIK
ncbi:MAG: type I DNA topoisomerase [Saprospiraceae bacterium]|nr:type I DNA topoisomerase [Saprospiraceae bacterium]